MSDLRVGNPVDWFSHKKKSVWLTGFSGLGHLPCNSGIIILGFSNLLDETELRSCH